MKDADSSRLCECFWPRRAVTEEPFPVTFDDEVGEYQLVLDYGERGQGMAVLRFCPGCGGALPKSKRGDLFTVVTDDDRDDASRRMQGVRNADEMRAEFGEPSDRSHRVWRTQHTYDRFWDSLTLIIHEYDDGHLEYFICGKQKTGG